MRSAVRLALLALAVRELPVGGALWDDRRAQIAAWPRDAFPPLNFVGNVWDVEGLRETCRWLIATGHRSHRDVAIQRILSTCALCDEDMQLLFGNGFRLGDDDVLRLIRERVHPHALRRVLPQRSRRGPLDSQASAGLCERFEHAIASGYALRFGDALAELVGHEGPGENAAADACRRPLLLSRQASEKLSRTLFFASSPAESSNAIRDLRDAPLLHLLRSVPVASHGSALAKPSFFVGMSLLVRALAAPDVPRWLEMLRVAGMWRPWSVFSVDDGGIDAAAVLLRAAGQGSTSVALDYLLALDSCLRHALLQHWRRHSVSSRPASGSPGYLRRLAWDRTLDKLILRVVHGARVRGKRQAWALRSCCAFARHERGLAHLVLDYVAAEWRTAGRRRRPDVSPSPGEPDPCSIGGARLPGRRHRRLIDVLF